MAKSIQEISYYLENINLKKKKFGGFDELSVWNAIDKLNSEYRELYNIQQAQIEILKEKLDEN